MANSPTPELLDDARFELLHKVLGASLQNLLDQYVADCHSALDTLADHIRQNNPVDGMAIAHRMKGASASIGASQMRVWFTEMEDAIGHGGNHADDWQTTAKQLIEQTRTAAQAVFQRK